jgi:cytidylate kinase
MERIDRERRDFVRSHHRHDLADPLFYDLVVNTDRITTEQGAEAGRGENRRRNTA